MVGAMVWAPACRLAGRTIRAKNPTASIIHPTISLIVRCYFGHQSDICQRAPCVLASSASHHRPRPVGHTVGPVGLYEAVSFQRASDGLQAEQWLTSKHRGADMNAPWLLGATTTGAKSSDLIVGVALVGLSLRPVSSSP